MKRRMREHYEIKPMKGKSRWAFQGGFTTVGLDENGTFSEITIVGDPVEVWLFDDAVMNNLTYGFSIITCIAMFLF